VRLVDGVEEGHPETLKNKQHSNRKNVYFKSPFKARPSQQKAIEISFFFGAYYILY